MTQLSKRTVQIRNTLLELLTSYFSVDDLKSLCFKQGIDHENLQSGGKSGFAREIIEHFEHHRRVPDLIEAIKEERSFIDWETKFEKPSSIDFAVDYAEVRMESEVRILVIFANPRGSDPLRLGEEDRFIRECIRKARKRDTITCEILHAARVRDVQLALIEDDYHLVHFSGHATPTSKLALEDETGKPKLISQQALANLLAHFGSIECVLLNACYTLEQGRVLSLGVPFTIAMDGPISDDAAKYFTRGFYDALGAGRDYRFAYTMGCVAMDMEAPAGLSEAFRPKLFERS